MFFLLLFLFSVLLFLLSRHYSAAVPACFVSFSAGDAVHKANQSLQRFANRVFNRGVFSQELYHTPASLAPSFYDALSPQMRTSERGHHFWSWKPYIILQAMRTSPPDTVICYLDSGAFFWRNVSSLLRAAKRKGRLFFPNFHPNENFCKPIDGATPEFLKQRQLDASCVLFTNTPENERFVQTWLDRCMCYECVSDELPRGVDWGGQHRHDQALLSLLVWDRGDGENEEFISKFLYIVHHRRRKLGFF